VLAEALAGLEPSLDALSRGAKVDEMVEGMKRSPERLRAVAGQLGGAGAERKVLLVVDQLEELFTESRLGMEGEADEAMPFVRNIIAATSGDDAPLRVVSTLRSDFVPHYLRIAEFATIFNDGNCFALRPMQSSQVREAIELPAARVGFAVEQGVVVELVNGTAEHTGRLPLLEYMLEELWRMRDNAARTLTLDAYERAGGLEGAIAEAGERGLATICKELGDERAVAVTRRVMSRLVNVGETMDGDTRRQASVDDLGRDEQTRQVLDVLVREVRVLVSDGVDGREAIEIAHEALLREWSTLVGWLDADRGALRLRQELGRDAVSYAERQHRGKGWIEATQHGSTSAGEYLWGRGRVEQARGVLAASVVELNDAERSFLEASERVVRKRRLQVQGGVAGALSIAAIVVAVVVGQNAVVERTNREVVAKNREIVAEKNRVNEELRVQKSLRAFILADVEARELEALQLGVEAWGISGSEAQQPAAVFAGFVHAVTRARAGPVLDGQRGRVEAVAFSPDGTRIATASSDGTTQLWDTNTNGLLVSIESNDWNPAVVFSSDGGRIATAGRDASVQLWDVETGEILVSLGGDEDPVYEIVFSPDGSRVAASNFETVRIWDAGGEPLAVLPVSESHIPKLHFSLDGTRVAAVDPDGRSWLWDAGTGKALAGLTRPGELVAEVAFLADGLRIATLHEDHVVQIRNAKVGKSTILAGHDDAVQEVALSSDGKRIVTSSRDDTIRVWDANSGEFTSTLEGSAFGMFGLTFSPDGALIAAVTEGGDPRLWSAHDGELIAVLKGHGDWVPVLAFSPDGTRIATGSWDGTIRLWNASFVESRVPLESYPGRASAMGLSPDCSRLAAAGYDGTVRLWNASTGAALATPQGHDERVRELVFSPDSARLAAAGYDGTVRLWNAGTGELTTILEGPGGETLANDLAFSQDGTRIATACADGITRLWDTNTGEETLTLKNLDYDRTRVHQVAFSPNGAQLLTAGEGPPRLWDANTGEFSMALDGTTSGSSAMAFSSDGSWIAVANDDVVQLWDAQTGSVVATLVGHERSVGAVSFSPDGTRVASAGWNNVRLWDTTSGQLIAAFDDHGGAMVVGFSLDAARIIAGDHDGIIRTWDATPLAWLDRGCRALNWAGAHTTQTLAVCSR
jgi:WD40 repeat protein